MICDQCETVAHFLKNGCVPKTTTKDEALKLALEALEHCKDVIIERGLNGNPEFAKKWGLTLPLERSEKAITAISEALAEDSSGTEHMVSEGRAIKLAMAVANDMRIEAMKTQPAQRKPLMDEEIERLAYRYLDVGDGPGAQHYVTGDIAFARAIEAAHQIGVEK